jgi:hypothetical protein
MQAASESMQIKTGKRLGFRFQVDSDEVDWFFNYFKNMFKNNL